VERAIWRHEIVFAVTVMGVLVLMSWDAEKEW
jgi:hypothetical protein